MYIRSLLLTLILYNLFSCLSSMQDTQQSYSNYNQTRILTLTPNDIWLRIIASCPAKNTIRALCSYFREYASTKNEAIFLQKPLLVTSEILKRFTLYYADFARNEIFNNLLYHGANPNYTDDRGYSIIEYCAKNNNLAMIKTLFEHPNFVTKHNKSALIIAATYKYMDIVHYILSQLDTINNGFLHAALYYDLPHLVDLLLPHVHPGNGLYQPTHNIFPFQTITLQATNPLHMATKRGYLPIVQHFINHISIDMPDNAGNTPLHYAITQASTAMIELLIKNNANINSQNYWQQTPLHFATEHGMVTRVQFLLHHNANSDAQDQNYNTALHILSKNTTSKHSHLQIAQLLLANSTNINKPNKESYTPLHLAFKNRKLALIKLLLNEPSIELKTTLDDKSFLSLIAEDPFYSNNDDDCNDIINLLLKKTDINQKDMYGNCPLSYAVWKNNITLLTKLLDQPTININALHGQNESTEFKDVRYERTGPMTALDIAFYLEGIHGQQIIKLLLAHGAKTSEQLKKNNGFLETCKKILPTLFNK